MISKCSIWSLLAASACLVWCVWNVGWHKAAGCKHKVWPRSKIWPQALSLSVASLRPLRRVFVPAWQDFTLSMSKLQRRMYVRDSYRRKRKLTGRSQAVVKLVNQMKPGGNGGWKGSCTLCKSEKSSESLQTRNSVFKSSGAGHWTVHYSRLCSRQNTDRNSGWASVSFPPCRVLLCLIDQARSLCFAVVAAVIMLWKRNGKHPFIPLVFSHASEFHGR